LAIPNQWGGNQRLSTQQARTINKRGTINIGGYEWKPLNREVDARTLAGERFVFQMARVGWADIDDRCECQFWVDQDGNPHRPTMCPGWVDEMRTWEAVRTERKTRVRHGDDR
jgi:hypothetical protein